MKPVRPCAVCGTTRKSAQSARCARHLDRRARRSKCSQAMRDVWAQRKASGYVPNDRGVQAMQRYNQARKHGIPYEPDLTAHVIDAIIAREHRRKRPTWNRSAA